ncbi:hypothetical protein D1AOALGA4SA_4680 [Olavius algarvensis Delta 1 endosymbiont]|nr:hypothetical protein D1AOALGA4SA_4680 [Olavius algarvensis Delta 1 endosymbiont]
MRPLRLSGETKFIIEHRLIIRNHIYETMHKGVYWVSVALYGD